MTPEIFGRMSELKAMILEIKEILGNPAQARESYSVEEAAKLLGREPYTVREWCRHGRINASKRREQRGEAALWSISTAEVARIKDEGLLPPDPKRNSGR
jgi:hypothetical protein